MKTNKKLLLLTTITIASLGSYGLSTNADSDSTDDSSNNNKKHAFAQFDSSMMDGEGVGRHMGPRANANAYASLYEDASDEIKALIEKEQNGEELTTEEKAQLREYAKAKKEERRELQSQIKEIMDKYRNGEELTTEEKEFVLSNRSENAEEMFNQRMENENISDEIKAIMTKKFNLETLTEEEEETLENFKEEQQAEREEVMTVMQKYRSGEELTTEEKELLSSHNAIERMINMFGDTTEASSEVQALVEKLTNLETLDEDDIALIQEYLQQNRGKFKGPGNGQNNQTTTNNTED